MKREFITTGFLIACLYSSKAFATSGDLFECQGLGDAQIYVEIDTFDDKMARHYVVIDRINYPDAEPPSMTPLKSSGGDDNRVYTGQNITFNMAGSMGTVVEGRDAVTCRTIDPSFIQPPRISERTFHPRLKDWQPTPNNQWNFQSMDKSAVSWGGRMRAGPGLTFTQTASLSRGQNLRIISQTDKTYLDRPWFQVRLENDDKGYVWGGILCSLDSGVDGTFNHNNCK